MKRFIIWIIGAVVLGGIIGGVFVGGIAIGKDQGREEMTQEMQERTGQFASHLPPSDAEDQESDFTPPTGAFSGRSGTIGTVEEISSNVIRVQTMNGSSVDVITSDDTTFQKMEAGTLNDIEIGVTISISGETQDDGSIKADSIFVTPEIGQLP